MNLMLQRSVVCLGLCLAVPAQSATAKVTTVGLLNADWAYDEARQRLVVAHAQGALQEFDGQTWALMPWSLSPGMCAAYDSQRGRCYFVGGAVLEYDGHAVRSLGSAPSFQKVVADESRARLVGLRTVPGVLGVALEEFDGVQWTAVAAIGGPRAVSSACYDRQRQCTVVQVVAAGPGAVCETWEWRGSVLVGPLGDGVPRPQCAYDATSGRVLGTGGAGTYVWDGVAWSLLPTLSTPADLTALATDGRGGRVLGWQQVVSGPATLWEWDGVDWRTGLPAPQPVGAGQLTYHAGEARLLFCGDAGAGAERRQFAAWDGSKWQPLPLGNGAPVTLRGAACDYDDARGELLVFGGLDGPFGAASGVLSAYAQGGWRVAATTGPSPRHHAGFAFDRSRGRAVLVGGVAPGTAALLQDHWEWNGLTWTQVAATTPLAARPIALGYDPQRNRVVGLADFGTLRLTCTFDGVAWRVAASQGPGVDEDRRLSWNPQALVLQGVLRNAGGVLQVHTWDGSVWRANDEPIGAHGFDPVRGASVVHRGSDTLVRSPLHASATDVGTGCGAGSVDTTLTAFRTPRFGDADFHVDLRSAAGLRPALLGFGLGLGTVPLGHGCTYYLQNSVATQVGFTDALGFWPAPLPLPMVPSLRGLVLHAQGAVVDPAAPAGFALTQALSLRIGD
jgi:hypothetical protein